MATSFTAAYSDPNAFENRSLSMPRRACFGNFNSLSGYEQSNLEKMEFHPERSGASAKDCLAFVNSFGCWEDVLHLTSLGGLASSFDGVKADQLITCLMTARNVNQGYYSFLDDSSRNTEGLTQEQVDKIRLVCYVIGVDINRFGGLNFIRPGHDEGTTISLHEEDDAYGIYLLAYGSKADFEGAFVQGRMFTGLNEYGYLRGSSSNMDRFRRTLPAPQRSRYTHMSDWLRAYLYSDEVASRNKLGRLTVAQFRDRMRARTSSLSGNDITSTIFSMFEELKDLYS